MNKKLIITEEQYKNLKFFLLESSFFDMAEKTIKKGDLITITTNGKKINFRVIENFGGQIYMDNVDKNSEYFGKRLFLNKMSFENNNLNVHVAKDDQQKNETPLKGNLWPKMTLKNIEDISVSRDGQLIDGTNHDPKSGEKEKRKNRLLESLLTLNDGDSIVLETEGKVEEIVLDYLSKSTGFVHFELSEETEDVLGNADITGVDISTDEKDIEVNDEGLITIKIFTYVSKDGSIEKSESKIQNIKDFSIINSEDVDDEETDEDNEDIDGEDSNYLDINNMKNIMVNDPEMKLAMLNYKGKMSPSAWKAFANEFKEPKGPKSSGFLKVSELLNNYVEKKVTEKLGKNFLKKGKISFEPLDEIEIAYDLNGNREYFNLKKDTIYRDEDSVYYKGFDDSNLNQSEYDLKLVNRGNFEIMVKERTNTPNVYNCDVIKLYKVKSKQNPKKLITQRSEPQEDVKIRFINSDGYKAESTENK